MEELQLTLLFTSEATHLVNTNIHSLIVTLGRPGHKLAVVRSTGLEWDPLTGRVGQLFVNCFWHDLTVVDRLFSANLARLRAVTI